MLWRGTKSLDTVASKRGMPRHVRKLARRIGRGYAVIVYDGVKRRIVVREIRAYNGEFYVVALESRCHKIFRADKITM